jgi:ABC-type Fe3+-hydroxamate transport system substrate-binding protein
MTISIDQTGRTVYSPPDPLRIISLVPSQTELLFDLGLKDRIVGITRFCIHPENIIRMVQQVGGTKKIHHDILKKLNPDLIIANKEENTKEEIELLMHDYPVWISDVHEYESALEMIHALGYITNTLAKADQLIADIRNEFEILENSVAQKDLVSKKLKTVYLIWEKPLMVVGRENFIHAMLEKCGFMNAFADQLRYPITSLEEIKVRECDLVILPSEPFPFAQKHVEQYQKLLEGVKIIRADGEMFSWYGSRMKLAPSYFVSLIRQISR